ncbi:uncharacterized protein DUF4249 [Marinirhabdus gelatinilytica]|uniref:Uncharacterized protein DUF4249 n=2 Tax=Marinirhabdus gelatinilytica TaxID=1703343 RepID=A0A370QEP1_9FLAO|nr:uncharacterized protein DUF4249 [Marinirhabdus gelatinilytica]
MKRCMFLMTIVFSFWACEDVVDVELDESAPRLVIEAGIFHFKEQDRNRAQVILSETTPFFENTVTTVEGALVTITSENGTTLTLEEASGGIYFFENFPLDENEAYTLEVLHENETYTATETFESVPSLEFVEQNNEGGFTNDEIELKAFFTDPANVENYYFFEGRSTRGNMADTFFDEFFDGNQIFGFYFVEDLAPGDEVTFYLHGVDEQFYNFMFTLLQQSSDQSDGPFETQPATVRGNILNETNEDNFPLGYFRISEVSILSYTVQ